MSRFFRQSLLDFKGQRAAFSLEEFLLLDTLYPLISMIFYCLMAGYAFHTQDLTRWVIGNSFLLCIYTCIFSLGSSFMGERYFGRIRSIITAPISKMEIVLEKGFFPCIVCVITTMVGFSIGSIIFHVDWRNINMTIFISIILAAMLSATGFGMMLSTLGLVSDQMHMILNVTSNVLVLFCGANFPVSQLPAACQIISKFLPLTRSIEAVDLLLTGKNWYDIVRKLLGELGIAVIYVILAFGMIKIAEREAVKKGNLELF